MTASVDDNHVVIVGGTTPDVTAMEVVDVTSSSNNNHATSLVTEIWMSSEMLFSNKLSWLLILGPVALIGESSGHLGEAACFALSGIALIPCAERLSFVTEQVAEHTNGTIGALLNATFGNAPELLIATAALRNGFYRVVQLAMLGSMLTNLLFVFGMSCVVGGCRYQVQELRITSGNVNVGMLLLSVSGSLLPAALILGGQLRTESTTTEQQQQQSSSSSDIPSPEELHFCRVNAVVMIFMYGCYLLFQLGTHKEEFDEEPNNEDNLQDLHGNNKTRRNKFCLWLYHKLTQLILRCRRNNNSSAVAGGADYMPAANDDQIVFDDDGDLEMLPAKATHYKDHVPNGHINNNNSRDADGHSSMSSGHGGANAVDALEALGSDSDSSDGGPLLPQNEVSNNSHANGYFDEYNELATTKSKCTLPNNNKDASESSKVARRRRKKGNGSSSLLGGVDHLSTSPSLNHRSTSKDSLHQYQQPGRLLPLGLADPTEEPLPPPPPAPSPRAEPLMSFRVGIIWLFVITLCISALSDILVDTIDGFAKRLHLSEVFTSMVIVPYFSNVAEQVSAVLFAYRNEMDLCVGVTVGSAIQVACFVLPGSVLIGMFVDRSMTLYFHAYETVCLFLAVVVVAAVLQGGSTNWLVGTMLIGIYIMIASGFWFHTLEDLTVDAELAMHGGG